jgi:hypothetical protein
MNWPQRSTNVSSLRLGFRNHKKFALHRAAPPRSAPTHRSPNRAATVRERNHHLGVCHVAAKVAAKVPCTFTKIASVFSAEFAFRCAAVRVAGGALAGGCH